MSVKVIPMGGNGLELEEVYDDAHFFRVNDNGVLYLLASDGQTDVAVFAAGTWVSAKCISK